MTPRGGADMKRGLIATACGLLIVLTLAVTLPRGEAAAVGSANLITAAGAGVFPAGANVLGIELAGGTVGVGAQSSTPGQAPGTLEVQDHGTSLLGLSQWPTRQRRIP